MIPQPTPAETINTEIEKLYGTLTALQSVCQHPPLLVTQEHEVIENDLGNVIGWAWRKRCKWCDKRWSVPL